MVKRIRLTDSPDKVECRVEKTKGLVHRISEEGLRPARDAGTARRNCPTARPADQ
jgi:hypothetical protein